MEMLGNCVTNCSFDIYSGKEYSGGSSLQTHAFLFLFILRNQTTFRKQKTTNRSHSNHMSGFYIFNLYPYYVGRAEEKKSSHNKFQIFITFKALSDILYNKVCVLAWEQVI